MTDPASAIKRELDVLITKQIATFRRMSTLTTEDLEEFHTRSVKLDILFRELDRRKASPSPVYRNRFRIHPAT